MSIPVLEVYNPSDPNVKYYLNYYSEQKMTYLTFYHKVNSLNQVKFQNRFFHDNNERFNKKLTDILSSILVQNENYRFLYCNSATGMGKSTLNLKLKDYERGVGSLLLYILAVLEGEAHLKQEYGKSHHDGIGSMVATIYKDYWIYGIKRINRLLILLAPTEVSVQKLDAFMEKMTKEYFNKAFI